MFLDTSQQPNAFKPSIIVGAVAFGEVFFERTINHTITWTNDDSQPQTPLHPVKMHRPMAGLTPCILAPATTFEHTFTEAGKYPYFCIYCIQTLLEQSA
jgi:plastocyanin